MDGTVMRTPRSPRSLVITGCEGEKTGPRSLPPSTSTVSDQPASAFMAVERGRTYSTRPMCDGMACS